MTKLFVVAVLALMALFGGARADSDNQMLTEAAVIKTINNYGTDLNALIEYAVGPSCDPSTVDWAGAGAAGAALVTEYFSPNVQSFTVIQQDTNHVWGSIVLQNGQLPPAGFGLPNSTNLYQVLQAFYPLFNAFNSAPFWWQIDKPIVDAINLHDEAYGGATTAYVRASDVNSGFHCGATRYFAIQQSVYHHVMALEGHGADAAWRFIVFEETNANQVTIPGVVQNQPPPN